MACPRPRGYPRPLTLTQSHANLLRYLAKVKRPFVLRALLPWHVEAERVGLITIEPGPRGFVILASQVGLELLAAHPPYRRNASRTS